MVIIYIAARPAFPARLTETNGRVRYLTADELAQLLAACEPWPKLHALITVGASAGARAGELLALEWSDVNLKDHYALLRNTKTGTDRRMPLTEQSAEAIRSMRQFRVLPDPRVFQGFQYRIPWCKALAEAGIKDFRFHDLRHTAASHLVMNGATLLEIATVLGHKTLTMVQRYSHLCDDHVADVVARMNKELLP